MKLPNTGNRYLAKDQAKASKANKMIAIGVMGSSTYKYALANEEVANTRNYVEGDVVFVSVNGKRAGRISPYQDPLRHEIVSAIEANVTFITDNKYDRNREFNIGEREVANLLEFHKYTEVGEGVWQKK